MGKRIRRPVALFLTLAMCLGMVNLTALAGDTEGHEHNTDGWVCTQAEVTKTLACEEEEHRHTEECYAPGKAELTCEETEHAHTDECLDEEGNLICGLDEHEHGEECYAPGEDVLACEKAEHTHGDDCYTVTEGEWTCVNAVQEFLDAVKAIPDISIENAEEVAKYIYGPVSEAYEVLLGTGYEEREDVKAAEEVYAAAIKTVDAALNITSGTYGGYYYGGNSLAGFGAALGYDPKDTSKFPKTDDTDISVIPWNFHNQDHAKDYYYYIDYRLGLGEGNTHPRTEPDPDPVQSSYFEKTYRLVNDYGYYYDWYTPLEFTKKVEAGATGSLSWRQGVTNYNDPYGGLVPTIPSVYLYRLEEVEGAEFIAGGRNGITFKANDEIKLESSGGPVYKPTGPYIQCDVPISAEAPEGAQIQVRFRLAMGYEMEWQSSEGTYDWYVQDFILNYTVGEDGTVTPTPTPDPDDPDPETKVDGGTHYVYLPANYDANVPVLTKSRFYDSAHPIFGSQASWRKIADASWKLQKSPEITNTLDSDIIAVALVSGNVGASEYQLNITSSANANVGDTAEILVTYQAANKKNSSKSAEITDKIIVEIIAPRDESLNKGESRNIGVYYDDIYNFDFLWDTMGRQIVMAPESSDTSVITTNVLTNYSALPYRAKAQNKDGRATVEYQYYHNTMTKMSSEGKYDGYSRFAPSLHYWVDVVNFTVGNPPADDPNSIDGLNIKKEVNKTSVTGGDMLTYTITVSNTSSVDKTVTVTDILTEETTFVSSNPTDGVTLDGNKVTWNPTVKSGKTATLKITVKVADTASGGLTNRAELESANGSKKEDSVTTQATPKTYTVIWKGVDQDQGADPTNKSKWSELHRESNVTVGNEPTWETVKSQNNLTDPKSYTLNGKTYNWNGTWTEEWNAAGTEKTYWAVYVEKSGEGPGPGPDPDDFNIEVEKRITSGTTGIKNGSQVSYEVKVTNATKEDLPLYDLVIWDVMDPGLTMNMENGQPKGAIFTVENNGENTNIQYKGSAQIEDDSKTKTAYYWQLEGEFKKGAVVTLTYTDTVSNTGHDRITLYNIAHATGYTTAKAEEQPTAHTALFAMVRSGMPKQARDGFDPSTLFDPDREEQKVSGSSGTTGTGVGGSGGTSVDVEGNPYTVTFNPNGGNWSGDTGNKTVKVPKAETGDTTVGDKMPADPTREKYDFAGWKDAEGKEFTKDTPITDDLTVTAQWTPKAPTLAELPAILGDAFVTVDCTNSNWSHADKTYGVVEGGVTAPVKVNDTRYTVTVTNTPYVAEYNKTLSGHTASASNETKDITLAWDEADEKWKADPTSVTFTVTCPDPAPTYAVTYVWNAPAEVTVPDTAVLPTGGSYEEGTSVTVAAVPEVSITVGETTYKLIEWATEDATIADGKFTMPNKAVVLKGQWQKSIPWTDLKEYVTVTFDANGGTLTGVASTLVEKGQTVDKPTDPTHSSDTFDGWYLNDAAYDFTNPVTENITLVAHWRDESGTEKVTVTWRDGYTGAQVGEQKQVDKGTTTIPADLYPAAPSRDGYTFTGWSTPETDTTTGDITITAQWRANSTGGGGGGDSTTYYTLTINYVDGEGNAVATRYSRSHASGYDYSVTSPTVEGMTPDQTVVSGRLTRNTTVTVTYSPEEEIDEPDTPLVETPETEKPVETPEAEKPVETPEPAPAVDPVPEEENSSEENLDEPDVPLTGLPEEESEEDLNDGDVPLVSAPQTGDSLWTMVWVLLALVSAAGIVFLAVVGRKKGKRER